MAPTIVSFCAGDPSYYAAGAVLRDDCRALGLEHDVVELPGVAGQTWLEICRRKSAFCLEMQRKHQRPILWVDVDSRLRILPTVLEGATCDLACFLRGWRYLRDF